MKRDNEGFTLIELIIATTIILIVSLGFFGWASTIIQTNLSIERNNTAYTMAMDVAERLQRMPDNSLIQPKSGSSRCVGFDGSGNLRGCSVASCGGGSPNVTIQSGQTGMTTYTNPTQSSTTPYIFDNNACEGKTWVDTTGTPTCRAGSTITTGANASIDHPNSTSGTPNYDSINPIRSYKNTTYYAVWSIAYMPCNAGTNTDRRKIFITVYWIDPEPGTAIASGAAIKSVSIVVDKAIGTES